jgi:hypothetical protein
VSHLFLDSNARARDQNQLIISIQSSGTTLKNSSGFLCDERLLSWLPSVMVSADSTLPARGASPSVRWVYAGQSSGFAAQYQLIAPALTKLW